MQYTFYERKKQNISIVRDFIIDGNIDHTSSTFFKEIKQLNSGKLFELDLTTDNLKNLDGGISNLKK